MEITEMKFWNPSDPKDKCFLRVDDKPPEELEKIVQFEASEGRTEFEYVRTMTIVGK